MGAGLEALPGPGADPDRGRPGRSTHARTSGRDAPARTADHLGVVAAANPGGLDRRARRMAPAEGHRPPRRPEHAGRRHRELGARLHPGVYLAAPVAVQNEASAISGTERARRPDASSAPAAPPTTPHASATAAVSHRGGPTIVVTGADPWERTVRATPPRTAPSATSAAKPIPASAPIAAASPLLAARGPTPTPARTVAASGTSRNANSSEGADSNRTQSHGRPAGQDSRRP